MPTTLRSLLAALTGALLIAGTTLAIQAPHSPTLRYASHVGADATLCVNNDCPEPNNTLVDNGGPIITAPVVYTVEFSDSQSSLSPATGFVDGLLSPSAPNAAGAIAATLNPPFSSWWMQEYSRPSLGENISNGTYGGSITIYDPTLADSSIITSDQIANALAASAHAGAFPVTTNDIFVTFYRSGQEVTDGSENSVSTFCGYHTSVNYTNGATSSYLNYAVLPNETGAPGCAYAGATQSDFNNMTPVLSHELAETITDPTVPNAWLTLSGNEMADICADSYSAAAPVPYEGQSYWLQYFYSNVANGCYNGYITPTLGATMSSPTQLDVSLTSGGAPIVGQDITVSDGAALGSGTTDSTGSATITVPAQQPGTSLTAGFAGAGPLLTTSTQVIVPSSSLTLTGPSTVEPGATATLLATLSPPASGQTIVLSGNGTTASSSTDVNGNASFTITSPTNSGTYVYTATDASASLSVTYTLTIAGTLSNETLYLSGPTSTTPGTTILTATLSPPLANQTVLLSGANATEVAQTDASGTASFTLSLTSGQYVFEASASVDGITISSPPYSLVVATPTSSQTLTLSGPRTAPAGTTVHFRVTTTPAIASQVVTLLGGLASPSAVTNAAGIAILTTTAPSAGSYVYTASAFLADNTLLSSSVRLTVASPLLLRESPPTGHPAKITITATLVPPVRGKLVLLSGGTSLLRATTNAKGVARFTFAATRSPKTYTASVTLDNQLTIASITGPARASSILVRGGTLDAGQLLLSPNAKYRVTLTKTGLTLYGGTKVLWHTNTPHSARLILTSAGRLELVSSSGAILWSPKTTAGSTLTLTNAGRLVLSAGASILWSSGTPPATPLLPS